MMAEYGYTKKELETAIEDSYAKGDMQTVDVLIGGLEAGEYDKDEPTMSAAEAALSGFGQGGTFGFSDELSGLVGATAVPALSRTFDPKTYEAFYKDKSFGEMYREARDYARSRQKTAREEYPWLTTGSELAGGLAVPGMKAPKTMKGLAGQGAALGALAGAGYSEADIFENPLQFAEDVLKGGGIGGITAPAIPAIWRGGKALARKVRSALSPKVNAQQEISEAIAKDLTSFKMPDGEVVNLPPERWQQMMNDNPSLTLMDVGPNTRRLAQEVFQHGGPDANALATFLNLRQSASGQRTMRALMRGLDIPDDINVKRAADQLIDERRMNAAQLYDEAYKLPTRITRRMTEILDNPAWGNIYDDAATLAYSMERNPPAPVAGRMARTMDLDTLSRTMQSRVNKLFRDGQGEAAGNLKKLRQEFDEVISGPGMPLNRARSVYKSDSEVIEAMDWGKNIFKENRDFIADQYNQLSAAGKFSFKVSVFDELRKRVGGKLDDADITKELRGKENLRSALRTAFGSVDAFKRFSKKAAEEGRMLDTFRQANRSVEPRKASSAAAEALGVMAGTRVGRALQMHELMAAGMGRRLAAEYAPQSAMAHKFYQQAAPQLMGRQVPSRLPAVQEQLVSSVSQILPRLTAIGSQQPGLLDE